MTSNRKTVFQDFKEKPLNFNVMFLQILIFQTLHFMKTSEALESLLGISASFEL